MTADLIVIGKVYTANDKNLYVESFAVKDGKVIYVGDRQGAMFYRGDQTVVKEYTDGLVVPGFTEGHAHVTQSVELLMGPLVNQESVGECQQVIKTFAEEHPDSKCIYGSGFDPGLFGPDGPTAALLDEIVSDRAVMIADEGHHGIWVNSKAMEIAGITKDTPDPPKGHIVKDADTGEPTGFLQERAVDLMTPAMPEIGVEQYKEAILYYQQIGLSYGITNAFEPVLSYSGDDMLHFDAYDQLEKEGRLKITFRAAPTFNPTDEDDLFFEKMAALHKRFENRDKMQVNTVKFFMDGVVDGHTAVLREPYKMEPFDWGPKMFEQEDLNCHVTRALQEGYNVHIHAIGDAAIDEAINACEAGQKAVPGRKHRNAITHLQVCAADHPKRMAELGIVAVINPYWFYETPLYEPLEKPFLGPERAENMYFEKSFIEAGVIVSQASDFPVTVPPDTMFGLHMLVNRMDPKTSKEPYTPWECIGVEEALKVMTIGGAYENGIDDRKGSIALGKDADFVCLSQDVTGIAKEQIAKTRILETWINGKCEFKNKGA